MAFFRVEKRFSDKSGVNQTLLRYAPFEADITGNLGPAPVQAKVEVDPTIVSIGVAYRF